MATGSRRLSTSAAVYDGYRRRGSGGVRRPGSRRRPPGLRPARFQTRQAPTTSALDFPDRFGWQARTPAQVGIYAAAAEDAVKFAIDSENPANKDLALDLATTFGRASRSIRRSVR